MEVKARSREKRVSIFKRFWNWLIGSRSRSDGIQTQKPDPKAPERETARMPLPPQQPEAVWENPCQGRLYKRLEENKAPLRAGGFSEDAEALRVYEYCGVVFPKADIVYHYICTGENIQVGDRVLVPVWVHGEHKQAVGIVVSVGQYLDRCLPRPLQKTKYIIKKL